MSNLIILAAFILGLIPQSVLSQSLWMTTSGDPNFNHTDVSFINPNTGFAAGCTSGAIIISKTTDKGLNWNQILSLTSDYSFSKNVAIFFKTESLGSGKLLRNLKSLIFKGTS